MCVGVPADAQLCETYVVAILDLKLKKKSSLVDSRIFLRNFREKFFLI
jgi:hypothetical protein